MHGSFVIVSKAMNIMQTTHTAIGPSLESFAEQDQHSEFVSVFMTLCGHVNQVTRDLEETQNLQRCSVLDMCPGVLNIELNKMRDEQRQDN